MTTATHLMGSFDNDAMARRRSTDALIHLLSDFIPTASRRDAWELLYKAMQEQGWELTNAAMRKEYEAWKSLQIEGALGLTSPLNGGREG